MSRTITLFGLGVSSILFVDSRGASQPYQADGSVPVAVVVQSARKRPPAAKEPDVIYLPTPDEVVDAMLKLANIKKGEMVYDLGCGDGRIVIAAAKKYGAFGVGYDVDPDRIRESLANVKRNRVEDKVLIKRKDIFTLDLQGADVVTLYLLPSLNVRLIPQLEKLKPGARIVSHAFDMRGLKPDKVVRVRCEDGQERTIYLWTVPLHKEK